MTDWAPVSSLATGAGTLVLAVATFAAVRSANRAARGDLRGERRPGDFTNQSRDIYVPPGDTGFWQGAFRDPGHADYEEARQAIKDAVPLTLDLLYGDNEGGQRIITRYVLRRAGDDTYINSAIRHWNVDRPDPR